MPCRRKRKPHRGPPHPEPRSDGPNSIRHPLTQRRHLHHPQAREINSIASRRRREKALIFPPNSPSLKKIQAKCGLSILRKNIYINSDEQTTIQRRSPDRPRRARRTHRSLSKMAQPPLRPLVLSARPHPKHHCRHQFLLQDLVDMALVPASPLPLKDHRFPRLLHPTRKEIIVICPKQARPLNFQTQIH